MRLHVHEWGEPDAPPLICLHGVTGHGERFKRLAEERWAARFHVIAPDLRGHGRSGYEPPWTFATHVADLVETIDALGIDQGRLGRPFVRRPAHPRARRAPPRTDPARSPARPGDPRAAAHRAHRRRIGARRARLRRRPTTTSTSRNDSPPRELVLEDARLHCERARRRSPSPPHLPVGRHLDLRRARNGTAAAGDAARTDAPRSTRPHTASCVRSTSPPTRIAPRHSRYPECTW